VHLAYESLRLVQNPGITLRDGVLEWWRNWKKPGLVKITRSIAMFLLTIDPTFIPQRFGIWDFRFWI